MTKLIITGTGGRGVKFLGKILGEYLITLDYEVALTYSYDAPVRGGNISAFLTFDKEKIKTPIIDEADIVLYLTESEKEFRTKKIIMLTGKEKTNMFAFGKILKELNLPLNEKEISNILPERQKEKNIEEIEKGYKN